MNERIEELVLKAIALDVAETARVGKANREGDWLFQYSEKFAELIVRECIDVVDAMTDPEDSERYFWALQNASQKIKQHFGVEE